MFQRSIWVLQVLCSIYFKRTGSLCLTILKLFPNPDLFFHVQNKNFATPWSFLSCTKQKFCYTLFFFSCTKQKFCSTLFTYYLPVCLLDIQSWLWVRIRSILSVRNSLVSNFRLNSFESCLNQKLLKVSQFQNVFLLPLFRPKIQQFFFKNFCPSL